MLTCARSGLLVPRQCWLHHGAPEPAQIPRIEGLGLKVLVLDVEFRG